MLTLLDFNTIFFSQSDALGKGIGAMLMQDGHLLAFTSKKLCDRNLGKSTYEKEMLAILHAVDRWCPYMTGHHF